MFTLTKEAEQKLVDTVGSIAQEQASWRAICFNFDQLLEQYRSEYQIQIAVNLLGDLLFALQGGVFVCVDRTIILVCRNIIKSQLDKAVFQLRYLFMDDPLAYDGAGNENPAFCKVYDLGGEYAEFYQFCRKKLSQSKVASGAEAQAQALEQGKDGVTRPFTPQRLAHAEHDLNRADVSRVLRRQPICAVAADYEVRRVFDEHYVHIAHLRQMLRADTDFLSNRWLFRYLTQLLDDRMLDVLMSAPSRYFETPASLNLNIETVLSRKFRDFDSVIKPLVKVSLVIELQVGDVFSDITGYAVARNLLQKLGYRVCIDGLTAMSIVHIDRERLGFDLAKLQWNADRDIDLGTEEGQPVTRAIKNCGPNRVILTRCDTRSAVNYGQAMGINLFQGRFLDRILNPAQKVEN